jgi:hypothetical protein
VNVDCPLGVYWGNGRKLFRRRALTLDRREELNVCSPCSLISWAEMDRKWEIKRAEQCYTLLLSKY